MTIAILDVAEVMDTSGLWWAVAGGWAIDLWLGRTTRDHHDVEVAIRRDDQLMLPKELGPTWRLRCLDPPGTPWRELPVDESLEAPAFQLQARGSPGQVDIFLESVAGGVWTYRRDDRIQRPIEELRVLSSTGIPVVRPEVQLLYMAKSSEAKNQQDFENARPQLDDDAAAWLRDALLLVHPRHAWLQGLPS